MKILIDTNILVDYLVDREPFAEDARRIIEKCSTKEVQGYLAAHSISNLFYILRKAFPVKKRKELLLSLCTILEVSKIDKPKVIAAILNDGFDDLEDCLQMECAKEARVDYIVTRNIDDFRNSSVKVVLPKDFLETFEAK
jgi:predicted nucleic acid-binding protein